MISNKQMDTPETSSFAETNFPQNHRCTFGNIELKPLVVTALVWKPVSKIKHSTNQRCLTWKKGLQLFIKLARGDPKREVGDTVCITRKIGLYELRPTLPIALKFACWTVLLLVAIIWVIANLIADDELSISIRSYWARIFSSQVYLDLIKFAVSKSTLPFRSFVKIV